MRMPVAKYCSLRLMIQFLTTASCAVMRVPSPAQNFTGSGDVDQAPSGVVFPMTYEEWYAVNGGSAAGPLEDAFVDYLHEWLLAELEVNGNMTIEQIEDEFMPLIEAGDYTTFPAEMLWNGMLEQGVPMTFEEFEAAGGVY